MKFPGLQTEKTKKRNAFKVPNTFLMEMKRRVSTAA
jgi:hypothetical protein